MSIKEEPFPFFFWTGENPKLGRPVHSLSGAAHLYIKIIIIIYLLFFSRQAPDIRFGDANITTQIHRPRHRYVDKPVPDEFRYNTRTM